MPRGIPKAGFRKTKNMALRLKRGQIPTIPTVPIKVETEAEVYEKLTDRFDAMHQMAEATARGKNRSLIISGPAGLGKSFGVMQILSDLENKGYQTAHISGYIRPTGLYKTLYEFRGSKAVIVFDDADSIFSDEAALNLLKIACDMTKTRRLNWLTETKMEDEEGERMPRSFEFEGSIIFITNYDFDAMIQGDTKLAPHFEAMISRSHYLDLAMKTNLDYVVRIKQVVYDCGMLTQQGFTKDQQQTIVDFIVEHQNKLRELSLRMVLKLAGLMRMNPTGWQKLAKVSCMR